MDKKLKILIAEDEKAIAGALSLKLNHEGFEAEVAFNGKEAIDLLEKDKFDYELKDEHKKSTKRLKIS